MQKRQKLVGPDEPGVQGENLLQLDHRQVLAVLVAVYQGLVIFLDGLVDRLQPCGIGLHLIDIIICKILFGFQILADHPLTEGRYHFAHLKIHQSQKVPGFYIIFVEFQALPKTVDGSCQIPDTCFFQTVIIICIGGADQLLIQGHICPTGRTKVIF